jgi:hypothetical protein
MKSLTADGVTISAVPKNFVPNAAGRNTVGTVTAEPFQGKKIKV